MERAPSSTTIARTKVFGPALGSPGGAELFLCGVFPSAGQVSPCPFYRWEDSSPQEGVYLRQGHTVDKISGRARIRSQVCLTPSPGLRL